MQTSYTYTPEIQFVRKCWQPVFAEVPRPIRPINGYFGACAPSSYMLRWCKAGDCARMHHVRRGKDCYAGVAFKQTLDGG